MSVISLLLTIVLVMTAAWSIEDARWVLGRHELTGFLGLTGLTATLLAGIAGAARWPRTVVYPLAAVVGALLLPVIVGGIVVPNASPAMAFRVTANASVEAYLDLAWRGKTLTPQIGHYMLTLGLVVWATGIFAGYAVLGRGKPLDAIFAAGFVLLVNMSFTPLDQLNLLVLFAAAALLLLVRGHVSDEVAAWVDRRMGDAADVSGMYVRGGIAFVVASIAGSLLLTSTASSAPLANAWVDVQQRMYEVTAGWERYLPKGGPGSRISGVFFGSTSTITGQWVTDSSTIATVIHDPGFRRELYWRAVAFDEFDLDAWAIGETTTADYDAGDSLLGATGDAIYDASAMTRVTYELRPERYRGRQVLLGGIPETVTVPTELGLVDDEFTSSLERRDDAGDPYEVTALLWPDSDAGLTENKLRAAGTDYPDAIRDRYLGVPDGAVGPNARAILDAVRERTKGDTPYDLARTMASYLRSERFTYNTNVVGLGCTNESVVECFATTTQGYCQHYASTMAVLLREAGIPTRFVEGFLPGRRDLSGFETIRASSAHAWVEVYFPGYGWVPFDPTGGGVAQLEPLPEGTAVPSPGSGTTGDGVTPGSSPRRDEPEDATSGSGGAAGGRGGRGGTSTPVDSRGPLIAVGLLLALFASLASFAAYRRVPDRTSPPQVVFGRVSSIAGRLGFARRPSETVYEYAGSLGDVVPSARPELRTVAHATVEVAYGRHELEPDRRRALAEAETRIRVALLRLLFRRTGRRRSSE